MLDLVLKGLWETIYMTVGATVLAYIVGLPLGLVLAATAADGVRPNRGVNLVLGAIVNVRRSVRGLWVVGAGGAGGGGLGAIAINDGYSRYNTAVMLTMCAVIVVVVQCFQSAGTLGARLSDRRIR